MINIRNIFIIILAEDSENTISEVDIKNAVDPSNDFLNIRIESS